MMKKYLLIVLMIFAGAFVWNESLLYSQNNLLFNQSWYSYKKNFDRESAGAIYSLMSRTLLAGNHLIANKNLGHLLVFSREEEQLHELDFQVLIKQNGFIDLLFNYDGNQFEGVRISSLPTLRSQYYKSDINGRFLESIPFKSPFVLDRKIQINLRSDRGQIILSVNHIDIFKKEGAFNRASYGFYTSQEGLEIFRVKTIDERGQSKIRPFVVNSDRWHFLKYNLLFNFVLCLLMAFIIVKIFKTPFIRTLVKSTGLVFSLGILWFSFDYFYYSRVPCFWDYATFSFSKTENTHFDLERVRFVFFKKWYRSLGGEVPSISLLNSLGVNYSFYMDLRQCFEGKCEFFKPEKVFSFQNKEDYRIAYIGGSFADFVGVRNIGDCFFDQLGVGLNQHIKNSKVVNFVNPGIIFNQKVEDLKRTLDRFNPKLIILNVYLSNEDFNSFNQFVEYYKKLGTTVYYYGPADENSFNVTSEAGSRRAALKSLRFTKEFKSAKESIEFWDNLKERTDILHGDALEEVMQSDLSNKGLLWWDSNHMTPFGQKFIAQDVLKQLLSGIKKGPQ